MEPDGTKTNSPDRNESGFLRPDPISFPSGIEPLVRRVKDLGFSFGMYAPMGPADSDGMNRTIGYEKQDAKYFVALGSNWVKVRGVRTLCALSTALRIRCR